MNMDDTSLCNSIKKQKLSYAGHLLTGSAVETVLQILEGKMNSQTAQVRPRRMWMSLDSHEQIKNTAQERSQWRACVQTASMSTFCIRR